MSAKIDAKGNIRSSLDSVLGAMDKVLLLFAAVYVGTYGLSICPYLDGGATPTGIAIMALLGVIMFVKRMEYMEVGFKQRVSNYNSAIFIAGGEQISLWTVVRCVGRGMKVFAAVDDLESPVADWLRRHIAHRGHVLRFDPLSDTDAADAARFVRENLGSRVLIGALYSAYTVPQETNTLDLRDVRRSIEVNALGAVKIADAFASLLQEQHSRYVILADMAGRAALPSLQSYCISQAMTLRCTELIRKRLETYNVTVHVVEHLLWAFWKERDSVFFKEGVPGDGKPDPVNQGEEDDDVDPNIIKVMNRALSACLSKDPKAHYLPSYTDMLMDKIIRYTPVCVRDRAVNYYFTTLPPRKNRTL